MAGETLHSIGGGDAARSSATDGAIKFDIGIDTIFEFEVFGYSG